MNERQAMATHREWIECDHCEKPVAEVVDGRFQILNRHHGQWHLTVFSIRQIERILNRMRESEQEAA